MPNPTIRVHGDVTAHCLRWALSAIRNRDRCEAKPLVLCWLRLALRHANTTHDPRRARIMACLSYARRLP